MDDFTVDDPRVVVAEHACVAGMRKNNSMDKINNTRDKIHMDFDSVD